VLRTATNRGAAVMESVVASYLRELLAGVPGSEPNLFSDNLAATVARAIETYQSSTGLHLNAAQRSAVEMAVQPSTQRTYRWSGNRQDDGTPGDR
jgi:hypothetical protein